MRDKIKYICLSIQQNLVKSLIGYGFAYVILYIPVTFLGSKFEEMSDSDISYSPMIACLIYFVLWDISKDIRGILLEKKGSAEELKRKAEWNDTKQEIKTYIMADIDIESFFKLSLIKKYLLIFIVIGHIITVYWGSVLLYVVFFKSEEDAIVNFFLNVGCLDNHINILDISTLFTLSSPIILILLLLFSLYIGTETYKIFLLKDKKVMIGVALRMIGFFLFACYASFR